MPLNYAPGTKRSPLSTSCAGWRRRRDAIRPASESILGPLSGSEPRPRETVRFWKSCGVTHLTLGTYSGRGHLRRIDGRTLSDHLEAIRRYWNAVADLL